MYIGNIKIKSYSEDELIVRIKTISSDAQIKIPKGTSVCVYLDPDFDNDNSYCIPTIRKLTWDELISCILKTSSSEYIFTDDLTYVFGIMPIV